MFVPQTERCIIDWPQWLLYSHGDKVRAQGERFHKWIGTVVNYEIGCNGVRFYVLLSDDTLWPFKPSELISMKDCDVSEYND